MDAPVLALAAFAVGTVGNAVRFVPQLVRTAVRGRVAGLSRTAVWLAFTANVLWLCFGLTISDRLFIALGTPQTALVAATLTHYVVVTGWTRNARHGTVAVLASAAFAALALTGAGLALERWAPRWGWWSGRRSCCISGGDAVRPSTSPASRLPSTSSSSSPRSAGPCTGSPRATRSPRPERHGEGSPAGSRSCCSGARCVAGDDPERRADPATPLERAPVRWTCHLVDAPGASSHRRAAGLACSHGP